MMSEDCGAFREFTVAAKPRIRVLLSAYACEPGKGSEPGVGWRWTCGLAERVTLTVLTRSNNQEAIQREVAATSPGDPLRQVRFLYHDLGGIWKFLKRHRLLPTMAYYFLWQWTAARRFRKEANEADIVHHLTFCTSLCPGFWRTGNRKLAIGPTAAPLVNPYYLPLFGLKSPVQAARNLLIHRSLRLPWLRDTFRNAAIVVPANSETQSLFQTMNVSTCEVLLDTGAPERDGHDKIRPMLRTPDGNGNCVFLYAGVIERRKGLELVLRAFAEFQRNSANIRAKLILLGNGPDLPRLRKLADSLGIADRIEFRLTVPHDQVATYFQGADAFIFASVRDASGGVNLEAMAHGLPIICIAHQGVGDITDPTCAERIDPGPIPVTIEKIAAAITRLANDPQRRITMGENAARRAAEHFSWDEKFNRMRIYYQAAVDET